MCVPNSKTFFYWSIFTLLLLRGILGEHETVRLTLQHGEFASVIAGIPGTTMFLRLHATCNDTVILFHGIRELETSSQTISVPHEGSEGSEVFVLGGLTFRLAVRLTSPSLENPSFSALWNFRAGFDGIICLGPGSSLWEHWTGFAWGPDSLLLGHSSTIREEAGYMLQKNAGREFLVSTINGQQHLSGFAVAHGESIGNGVVRFDMSQPLSLLPPDCFAKLHKMARERGGPQKLTDVEIAVYEQTDHSWYSFALSGSLFSQRKRGYDMPLSTFAPNPLAVDGIGEFVLGRNMLGDFVVIGTPNGSLYILPSYKLLDTGRRHAAPKSIHDGSSLEGISSVCVISLVLSYMFVVADIFSVPARRCSRALTIVSLACIFLVLWTYHAGFAQHRFFSSFLFLEESERDSVYFWFVTWIATCCVVVVILWRAKKEYYITSNTALESALAFAIWFTQVDCTNDGSVFELLSLAFIAVMHAWVRNIFLLNQFTVSTIVASVVANYFLIWGNIVPLFSRFWFASSNNNWTAAYVWWFLSPLTSWFFYSILLSNRAFVTAKQRVVSSQ